MIRISCKTGWMVILLLVLSCYIPIRSIAQPSVVPAEAIPDTTTIWHVITLDENEFFGTLVERTADSIRMNTDALGEINIPFDQISRMSQVKVERIVEGELWTENRQASRYFLTSNGIGLRRGHGYYHNVWVFFNQITVGITDFASLGIGFVPVVPSDGVPAWISPKISIPVAGKDGFVHVGVGALAGGLLNFDERGFGTYFGSLTIGSRDRNVSIGVGRGFADGDLSDEVLLNFGAMLRSSRKSYALIEGLLWDLNDSVVGVVLFGGRHAGQNITLDFGMLLPIVSEITIVLPWVSVSVPFGR